MYVLASLLEARAYAEKVKAERLHSNLSDDDNIKSKIVNNENDSVLF